MNSHLIYVTLINNIDSITKHLVLLDLRKVDFICISNIKNISEISISGTLFNCEECEAKRLLDIWVKYNDCPSKIKENIPDELKFQDNEISIEKVKPEICESFISRCC